MQLPGVPSHSQEREAGSHALGGLGPCVCILHAGTLCVHSSQHPRGRQKGGAGETLVSSGSSCSLDASSCGLCPGAVFPGPEFSWEWLAPRLQTSPTPFPGHSPGAGLCP